MLQLLANQFVAGWSLGHLDQSSPDLESPEALSRPDSTAKLKACSAIDEIAITSVSEPGPRKLPANDLMPSAMGGPKSLE